MSEVEELRRELRKLQARVLHLEEKARVWYIDADGGESVDLDDPGDE